MPESILKIKNLNKKFYSKNSVVNAIDNVSFELGKGKTLGLVGESGSGKTTIGRTIMNLHTADSGIIEIDGKKYSGKLNKKQRKELYKNVQMIFQDPYSSLNGQKNIKAILEESLLVKGLKKGLLTNYTTDREEVFNYFGTSFSEFFWKGFWEYRNYANKTALDYYAKIESEILEVKIDKTKSIVDEWNKIDQAVFENKKEANTLILLKLNNFLGSLFEKWDDLQDKVSKGEFEDIDEKELFVVQNKADELKKKILHSDKFYKLEATIKSAEAKLEEVTSNIETLKVNYARDLKSKKKDLKKIISNDRQMVRYSSDLKTFEAQKLGLYLDKILFRLLKEPKLNDSDRYMDFDDLYIETEKQIYLDNSNFYAKIEKGQKITEAEVVSANPISPIVERIMKTASKIDKKDELIAKKLLADIDKLKSELVEVIKNDSKRDLTEIKASEAQVIKKLEKAKQFNKLEIEKYILKADEKAEKIKIKNKQKTDADSIKINGYRTTVDTKIKELLGEVLKIENFDELEFASIAIAKKSIKSKYKTNLKNNLALEGEIKRIFRHIKVAETLFSIKSRELKPLNFFQKKSIIKLLTLMKIFETLEEVGLNKGHVYGYPHEFSGGMRQRVGIARAIISNPKIIIADEPIAALDLSIQAQIVNLLSDLKKKRGLSVIFIAHDLAMVEFNSDDVLIMHLGKLVEKGKAEKIFKKPVHPYTKNLIDSMPSLDSINAGFKENNFKPTYLNSYSVTNTPVFHTISKEHKVLADEDQIKVWTKRK